MPQLDFDGANSKVSADKIQGQSGTTVTVPTGHKIAGTDANSITINGVNAVAVAPSTSGNVLTSTGSAWASSAAAGGLHTQIGSTNDVSNVSSIEWTSGFSGYKTYVIIGEEIIAPSSSAYLNAQVGDSSGFKTGTDYGFHLNYSNSSSGSHAASTSTGLNSIKFGYQVVTHANSTYNFIMRIHYMAGRTVSMVWDGVSYLGTNGYAESSKGVGAYKSTVTFDRFKIFSSGGGNFTGRFRLFGI